MPRLNADVSMDTLRKLNTKYGANNVSARLTELADADVAEDGEEQTGHTMERHGASSKVEENDKPATNRRSATTGGKDRSSRSKSTADGKKTAPKKAANPAKK
jgi:hypothetical protein